jgi:hypothetical protein
MARPRGHELGEHEANQQPVFKGTAAGTELLPAVKAVLEGKRFVSASLASHFLVATTLRTTRQRSRGWSCSSQEFVNCTGVLVLAIMFFATQPPSQKRALT